MACTVITWNLQGREAPDLEAVAEHLRRSEPDVVLLQEVQRRQAVQLAGLLGGNLRWAFKHWPLIAPAEGLAVITRHPIVGSRSRPLARRLAWWSWRRRVVLVAVVRVDGSDLRVVDVHLGAGVGSAERVRQARASVADASRAVGVVAGDLNAHPGSEVLDAYLDAGWRDAWAERRGSAGGPTNWTPGPRVGAPTQRLDYVLVADDLDVIEVAVPSDPGEVAALAALSDHLPVTARLRGRPVT